MSPGAIGRWLLPAAAPKEQARALVIGIAGLLGVAATLAGIAGIMVSPAMLLNFRDSAATGHAEIVVLFVMVTVFAPAAVFRTRNRARTEQLLTDPTAPTRHWDRATIQFDAVLAGAMLAGVYYFPLGALACFGVALLLRATVVARRFERGVLDARYGAVRQAFSALLACVIAYAIVLPLTPAILAGASFLPFLLAGIAAMYAGLAVNAVDRWVRGDRQPWSLARDVIDPRRLVIAAVSAAFAWLVILCATAADAWGDQLLSLAVGISVFLAEWILLWLVSLLMWRFEAMRLLRRWSEHQSRVVARLADGSLDPTLAARAGVATVGRVAMAVFGADRVVVRRSGGEISGLDAGRDGIDIGSMLAGPHREWRLQSDPLAANPDWTYLADLNWPGRYLVRTRFVPEWFRSLALETLVVPDLADIGSRHAPGYDELFDASTGLATTAAFLHSLSRMRDRCEADAGSSLVLAVFCIEDLSTVIPLKAGELMAGLTAEITRSLAAHERFLAYEAPGRVWVAVRSHEVHRALEQLRAVQESTGIARAVSLGTAVYPVDALDERDLLEVAEERLSAGPSAQAPLRPLPASGSDFADDLALAVSAGDVGSFVTPLSALDRRPSDAVVATLSWPRQAGGSDLSDPESFMRAVNRQVPTARMAADLLCDVAHLALADLDFVGDGQSKVVISMPSVLLHPDAGKDALPNIVAAAFDRVEASRTVLLFDTVPRGSGQSLRLLADRGFQIAVTSGAVATASPADLAGWRRWGVVLGAHLVEGPRGVDGLAIHQSITALASADTRIIGEVTRGFEASALRSHQIEWVVDRRRTAEQGVGLAG